MDFSLQLCDLLLILGSSFLMRCAIWWIAVVFVGCWWLMIRFLWVSWPWRFRFAGAFEFAVGFSVRGFGVGGDVGALRM